VLCVPAIVNASANIVILSETYFINFASGTLTSAPEDARRMDRKGESVESRTG
jgi:hypothetical protein